MDNFKILALRFTISQNCPDLKLLYFNINLHQPCSDDFAGGPCQDATGRGRTEGGGADAGRANFDCAPVRINNGRIID